MNPFFMGRRSFVRGLPLAGASAMLPTVALAARVEARDAKVNRLLFELRDAMADAAKHGNIVAQTFQAVVDGHGNAHYQSLADAREASQLHSFINSAPAADLAEYHGLRLGVALSKSRSGKWVSTAIPGTATTRDALLYVRLTEGAPSSFCQMFA